MFLIISLHTLFPSEQNHRKMMMMMMMMTMPHIHSDPEWHHLFCGTAAPGGRLAELPG